MDDVIELAWRAEESLLTAEVRNDPKRLVELLATDFYEIGQSGRRWSRDEIVDSLVNDTGSVPVATISDREATSVHDDTVLLSYRLDFGTHASRRSSLWRLDDRRGVQCHFHQGTPLTTNTDESDASQL